ncbi:MAG: acetate--CoA ligase family protein [Candidatus Roizmanbacteria bacterium]
MNLSELLSPRSIAVIGVSEDARKVGHLVAKNISAQGFGGELFFVNPKGGVLFDKPVYSHISDIPQSIDLAVLALPADISLSYLDELQTKGIHNVVIYGAGFKEVGEEGIQREALLIQKANEYGISLLGPNCIGFINSSLGINATFLKYTVPKGSIGFISQSGALGSVLVDSLVKKNGMGISYFISLGNKAQINESDAIEFLINDQDTHVIALYLEDVKDGPRFRDVLQKASAKKPVVVLKSGTTSVGSQAVISHTGGMVGDDQVIDAIFKQCNVIRAQSFEEFFQLIRLCSFKRLPLNNNVLVLTNAGGVGVLLADGLIHEQLDLFTISEDVKNKIHNSMGTRRYISVHNPIDLLGDASAFDYKQAISAMISEKDIGSIIVLLTPQANTQIQETAQVICEVQEKFNVSIYPVFMGQQSIEGVHEIFANAQIPFFTSYDVLPQVIRKLHLYSKKKSIKNFDLGTSLSLLSILSNESHIRAILQQWKGKPFVNLIDSLALLKHAGMPISDLTTMNELSDTHPLAKALGFPLVAKINSDLITHKTEVKGVWLDIKSEDELSMAFLELQKIGREKKSQVILQKMLSGYEVFVGIKRDATFGPVVIIGTGGIYTELYRDIAYRVLPVKKIDFDMMLRETHLQQLFDGFRGKPTVSSDPLFQLISALGACIERFNDIKEIDLNPVIVSPLGVTIVDARIILI